MVRKGLCVLNTYRRKIPPPKEAVEAEEAVFKAQEGGGGCCLKVIGNKAYFATLVVFIQALSFIHS